MRILDPKAIQTEKNESVEQAKIRVQKMASEESKLARDINQARDRASEKIKEIDYELTEYKKQRDQEKAELDIEIIQLKEKRRELLEPIDEIRAKAEADARAISEDRNRLEREKEDLETSREQNQEYAEANQDRSQELDIREQEIGQKEKQIIIEFKALEKLAENLTERQAELQNNYDKYEKQRLELEKWADLLNIRDEAQNDRTEEQNKRDEALNAKARLLESNYKALEQAKQHLGIKNDGKR